MRAGGGSLSGWLAVGVAALAVVMGLALAILWPRQFVFRLKADVILDDHAGTDDSDTRQVTAFLARALDRHHDINEGILLRLHLCARLACIAVGVETVSLILAV